ncbi:hypothetical protein IL45_00235 [Nonlabens ulvanivorans]|nr:hypothetical protein IL45_00235 [Nonlabens ulvanivorans]
MLFFTMFITSCETETSVQENNDFQKSTTFDAETIYWSILGNTESGMDQFDALTNEQKQAVWVFKYDRFLADNTLSASQIDAVNSAKDYVSVLDFSGEPNDTELDALEDELLSAFLNEDTKNFLFLSLENGAGDINAPGYGNDYQTTGCFWCWQEVPGADPISPCTAILNSDGDLVGYQTTVLAYRSRLFFRHGSRTFSVNRNCDEAAWSASGSPVSYQ